MPQLITEVAQQPGRFFLMKLAQARKRVVPGIELPVGAPAAEPIKPAVGSPVPVGMEEGKAGFAGFKRYKTGQERLLRGGR
jgi:hypothetical protein